MHHVILKGFPMSPSINTAFRNLSIRGLPGRAKSGEYRSFERDASIWSNNNKTDLLMARDLTSALNSETVFRMHYLFHFKRDRILMLRDGKNPSSGSIAKKKGEPKRNDTSNRIKCLEDVLFSLLGVDDSWAWAGSYDKIPLEDSSLPECIDITIELASLKMINQI